MNNQISRRGAIRLSAGALGAGLVLPQFASAAPNHQTFPDGEPWPGFPRQNADWAREVVGASHGNEARVRELVGEHPSLANATWDWGFGDWETALGAASHTGRRSIAEFLIANGARVDLFAAAMLGYVDVVRGLVEASPGIQKTRGPHGIHLLAHAKAGGDQSAKVVAYLESIGGAGEPYPSQPLSPDEQKNYVGEYTFGPSPTDRLNITLENDVLSLARDQQSKRRLTYLGNNEFHPVGAMHVRVRFVMSSAAAASAVKIIDGASKLSAARK